MLDELGEMARAGWLTDAFVVYRTRDGEYGADWLVGDLGDMLLQVRTEVILAQIPDGSPSESVN